MKNTSKAKDKRNKVYYRFCPEKFKNTENEEFVGKNYYELIVEPKNEKVRVYYPKNYKEFLKNPKKYALNIKIVEQNDRLEKTAKFKKIMIAVDKELEKASCFKTAPLIWFEEQAVLFEKYGITWFTEWDIDNIKEGENHFTIY